MTKRAGLVACVLMATTSLARAGEPLKLITSGELGLREGEKLYRLGMPVADFKKAFGEPDSAASNALDYSGEGLRVLFDKAGKVSVITLAFNEHTRPSIQNGEIVRVKVSPARDPSTDKGLTPTSTHRDVIKAYGQPVERVENGGGSYSLVYSWGEARLGDGKLHAVLLATKSAKE